MAYLDRTDPRSRATAVIGVGLVHALLAAGLLTGLAVNSYRERENHIVGMPLEPPPPPKRQPPPPEPSKSRPVDTAPKTLLPIPHPEPTVAPYDPSDNLLHVDPTPQPSATFIPQPTPTPSFAPKGVAPLGNPGRWITTEDYPARALRSGEAGLTRYRLVIGSSGKVTACEITGSSGSAELDRETCRLLARRGQFAPATDSTGAKVVGNYSGSVRLDIPD
jgi:protein TonB